MGDWRYYLLDILIAFAFRLPPYGGGRGERPQYFFMKKEYIEPAMRLAELRHRNHLLQSSYTKGNIYQLSNSPFGKYNDSEDELTEEYVDDII